MMPASGQPFLSQVSLLVQAIMGYFRTQGPIEEREISGLLLFGKSFSHTLQNANPEPAL